MIYGYFETKNDKFGRAYGHTRRPWLRLVNWIFLGFFPGGYTGEMLGATISSQKRGWISTLFVIWGLPKLG